VLWSKSYGPSQTLSQPRIRNRPKARNAFWIALVIALVIGPSSLYPLPSGRCSNRSRICALQRPLDHHLHGHHRRRLISRVGRVTLGMSLLIGALMLGNLTVAFVTVGFGLLAGVLTFVATAAILGLHPGPTSGQSGPHRRPGGSASSSCVGRSLWPQRASGRWRRCRWHLAGQWWGSLPWLSVYSQLRQFATFTLRTKLIALFLAVSLTPVDPALLLSLNYQSTRTTLLANTNQSLLAAASQTALTRGYLYRYHARHHPH